jgi:hypothetical protein
VLLGEEEYADGERGDKVSTVARSEGPRWSRARAIARRSPLPRKVTSVVDELLKTDEIEYQDMSRKCERA